MLSIILYNWVRICCTNLKLGQDKNTLCEIKRTIKEYKKKWLHYVHVHVEQILTRLLKEFVNQLIKYIK